MPDYDIKEYINKLTAKVKKNYVAKGYLEMYLNGKVQDFTPDMIQDIDSIISDNIKDLNFRIYREEKKLLEKQGLGV